MRRPRIVPVNRQVVGITWSWQHRLNASGKGAQPMVEGDTMIIVRQCCHRGQHLTIVDILAMMRQLGLVHPA